MIFTEGASHKGDARLVEELMRVEVKARVEDRKKSIAKRGKPLFRLQGEEAYLSFGMLYLLVPKVMNDNFGH